MKLKKQKAYEPREDVFPYIELAVLFIASLTSAIPLTGLFPYIAFMVVDLHAASSVDTAGYVSGYLASSFMLGRLLSSFYWGHVADKVGRKPVAYISCLSIILFSITFGLSLNLPMALLSRFALGLLNPLNTIAKTLISEICCPKHQPMGMSLATGSWSVGLVIGPALGGCLSRPAMLYPSVFGGVPFFETFPYILPNLVTAVMAFISLIFIYFYLPETLKTTEDQDPSSDIELATIGESRNSESGQASDSLVGSKVSLFSTLFSCNSKSTAEDGGMLASIKELCNMKPVRQTCLAYFLISLLAILFDEIFPLWAQSSRSKGGLGMDSSVIGQIGSMSGVPMMFVTFLIFPLMSRRFGEANCFRYGQLMGGLFAMSPMFVTLFSIPQRAVYPTLILISSGARCCCVVAFASVFLLINKSVPASKRGAVNGLSMTVGGLSKAIGPFAGSIIFAWSINNSFGFFLFNYTFVFFIIGLLAIGTCFISLDCSGGDAEGSGSGSGSGGGGNHHGHKPLATESQHGLIAEEDVEDRTEGGAGGDVKDETEDVDVMSESMFETVSMVDDDDVEAEGGARKRPTFSPLQSKSNSSQTYVSLQGTDDSI